MNLNQFNPGAMPASIYQPNTAPPPATTQGVPGNPEMPPVVGGFGSNAPLVPPQGRDLSTVGVNRPQVYTPPAYVNNNNYASPESMLQSPLRAGAHDVANHQPTYDYSTPGIPQYPGYPQVQGQQQPLPQGQPLQGHGQPPIQGGQPPMQGGHPQLQYPQGQQQFPQAPPVTEDYGVERGDYDESISNLHLNIAVDAARDKGVAPQDLNAYVQQHLEGDIHHFGSPEVANEYLDRFTQLSDALGEQYGEENVSDVLDAVTENIRSVGGDDLVAQFERDPELLNPAVVAQYLPSEGRADSNPYTPYLQGGRTSAGVPVSNINTQGTIGRDPSIVQAEYNSLFQGENAAKIGTPEWGQRAMELAIEKNRAGLR